MAFESDCAAFVRELDHNINGPRLVFGRMDTTAGIVVGLTLRDVGGVTSVVPRWILGVPENVHNPLGHASPGAGFLPCEIKGEIWRGRHLRISL